MKKKLKLKDLEVKSFITSLHDSEKNKHLGALGSGQLDCVPTLDSCFTPAVRSINYDCPFTRVNNYCIRTQVC